MNDPRQGSGFTVMEVMVAILILAVSVVSIFGQQFAAVATVDFARHTTHAVQLARCRMSEIELDVQIEGGFEEDDVIETGECCELLEGEADISPFTCSWEIKTVELPDVDQMLTGGGADGGLLGDMLGMGMDDDMGGDFGAGGMIAAFAPMLGEILKQAMRRVTVTVEWEQGSRQRDFKLSQYLVHPTQGPLQLMHSAMAAEEMAEQMGFGENEGEGGGAGIWGMGGGGGGKRQ